MYDTRAYVCHMRTDIKYSPWKMWYIACMVRGMTVDEAIKQLSFVKKKGARAVKETILEAQKLAVEKHNVEFKSNLWVAESFVGKGVVIKGMRRHARMRVGKVEYFHCHYFVRLEEGTPPKDYYYYQRRLSGPELLDKWLNEMRNRKINNSI
ncbi:54S ribosomal protein L22, mitochondrial [Periplaneta americana]|uniref:Large ribosomal subunit protein uL22m n=1 Tax=Periplaneta americana TaxID=6978 RepID=A0ABQ8TAR1_PERAM|nr:54S ribosomal protein L22, mitochondrial [Periplaneta americana]